MHENRTKPFETRGDENKTNRKPLIPRGRDEKNNNVFMYYWYSYSTFVKESSTLCNLWYHYYLEDSIDFNCTVIIIFYPIRYGMYRKLFYANVGGDPIHSFYQSEQRKLVVTE